MRPEPEQEVMREDTPESVVSQAVDERAEHTGEDDEGEEEQVLDVARHDDAEVQCQHRAYYVEGGGDQTQAQLEHVQQHRLAGFGHPRRRRWPRRRPRRQQDADVGVQDDHAHQQEVEHCERRVDLAEARPAQSRLALARWLQGGEPAPQRQEVQQLAEGVQRRHAPHHRHGGAGAVRRGDAGVSQREADGHVALQGHQGQGEGRGHGDGVAQQQQEDAQEAAEPCPRHGHQVERHAHQEVAGVGEEQVAEEQVARGLQEGGPAAEGEEHDAVDVEAEQAGRHGDERLRRHAGVLQRRAVLGHRRRSWSRNHTQRRVTQPHRPQSMTTQTAEYDNTQRRVAQPHRPKSMTTHTPE